MADIKEVIDMMVADGRPESEIIALIDRYNKDNEPGKTTDPASDVMDSGSESGLLEQPKTEDVAKSASMGAFYDSGLPSNIKKGMTIVNVIKAIPTLLTDSEERAELGRFMKNRVDNIPEALQSALISTQAAYMDTYRSNYLDKDGKLSGLVPEEKLKEAEKNAGELIIKKYNELGELEFKDTGKGIVAGAKEGDAASLVAGVFGAGVSMAETMIPAMATGGLSLPVQIAAPMYTDYNKAKAKALYGEGKAQLTLEEEESAIRKLVENNETEIATPLALGAIATGLEYIGFKGVDDFIRATPGKGKILADLMWTGNKEGFTEVGQLGVEKLNQGLGGGKSIIEASGDAWNAMASDEGLEMWLNGFLGSTQMSVGGRTVNRALRNDNASVKDLNNKINNLADLNSKKYNTKNKDVKEAIDVEIKEAEQDLKNYIVEKRKVSEILNEDQKQSLIDIINKKDNIKSKVESLRKQVDSGEISAKEFGYAARSLNNQDKRLSEEIELVNATAKEQLLQTSLETTKQETEKLGLEQIELSQEEFAKQFPDDADSDGAIQGNKIFINRDVARETGAIGVGSHELLHGIIGNSYQKLGKEEKVKLNTEFLNLLGSKEKQAILTRLANSYSITGDKVFETEELFTAFSDEIVDGGLAFNEGVFGKVKNTVHKVLNKFGYRKEFESARQTYNFLKDYSKNIKEGKLTERASKFAKEDPGVKGERFSKEASDKVQNIYKEQGEAGAFEIIEQFKPIVSKIAEKRREAPNFDKELLMSEIEIGERGILDLISKYDPDSGVPLAAYINKFLPSRAIEASRRVLGEEFTEDVSERVDIAAEEVAEVEVEAKPKKKKIILSDRLGVKGKVDKAIKTKLPELDIENLNFKTLKDQTPEITGEMFGISPKKLISGANITKKELQSAQMFINKNADVLISMLPEGATASGTATGVPQTLLKAFYTKTDRAKMAKTGTKAGLAVQVKNDIKKVDFLETFGIIDGKPDRTDRNTSARVLALANQTGKMMTNQAVRQELVNQGQPLQALGHIADGKATVMFSKSKQAIGAIDRSLSPSARVLFWDDISTFTNEDILDRSLESIKIGLLNTYENIPEITGKIDELATALHKVIKNLKDPVVKNPIKLTEKLLETNNKQLSKVKEFFNSIMTAADAFRQPQRVKNFRATTSVLANKIFNPSSLEKSIAKILMMRGHLASSSRNSYLKRKQPYPGNPEFLKGTLGSIPGIEYKTKLTKDGKTQLASVTYKGKNISLKKITSSQTSKAALNDAKDISKLKERSKNEDLAIELLDEITDFYTELYNNSEIDNVDLQMVSASLLSNMDAVLARAAKLKYISDNAYNFENPGKEVKYEHMQPRVAVLLNLWDAKINGDGITDVKDFLKNYTIQVIPNTMDKVITESKLGESLYIGQTLDMPSWIRTYNEATKENDKGRLRPLIDVYTKKVLKPSEAIVKALRILKPDIKKNKTLNKAIAFSRSSNNETKGITVLDFDDTLATTKSGVRAKIPNTDGTPKPGRKVIFLAGGAGSGKGNVISKLGLKDQGFKVVNSDISLEWLKKNNGLPENMNDFTKEQRSTLGKLQHQARGIAKRKMTKYQGDGNGVVVDGTGGSIKSMQNLVNQFEADGYDVSMMFVETSLPVALERNAARKERSLLDKIVEKNHAAVQDNKDGFKTMFGDRFMEVNTDNLSQQDAMPTKLTDKMNDFVSSYENRRLDAEEFASEGADILDQGGTFDFSEFNKVVEGQTAPLFEKAMKLQKKFGNKDMFVLTARPAESAQAIFEFLKANGLNIPLKNITGLANSTPESKALWIADKVGEGYNDFYFADDALQNVQAVKNMLDQFDVKSKVQQAKVKFSKSMNDKFNDILENVTGIESNKRFSIIKGRKRGEGKGKFRVFIPPSHEDFVGLLYNFLGKGKEGNAHRDFFEQALIRPLNRANREYDTARQSVANDYKELNKQFEDVRKKLTKKTPDGDFTFQDAVRVYLWDKHGHKIPGLSETDQAKLAELVMSDPQLQAYAETLNVISKQETYVNPTDGWNGGDIRMDLDDATGRVGRKQFFSEFIENADVIFSEENLNKIEAGYGKGVRESLEDMLYRIETGRNRPTGQNEQVNKLMNYLNGSVGTVMFFNMRSALLQQMSIVNYINFADNNIFAAAKAFANQKQYWKDFAFIFNSDMLKQRRGGIQTDINGAELAASLRNSKDITRKLISKLLELGFLPTQIGDNIAIATGGAAYYRNRINKYIKQGMSQKEAEAAAFTDFQDITQSTQQSARPDMVSKLSLIHI